MVPFHPQPNPASSSDSSPNQRTMNASSWWERSIVKRSTHPIQNMVDTMMEDSHFLQKQLEEHQTSSSVLSLHRHNIQTGALLGKGSFSVVYEVKGLIEDRQEPPPAESEEEQEQESRSDEWTPCTAAISILDRQDLLQGLEGKYAIKHLRPDLVQRPEMFQAAAADLLLEARYLAALDHPGILKLRAVACGGVSAYEMTGGQYDGYFLLTDRLDGTLRDKILEWQVLAQDESLLEFGLPVLSSVSREERKDDVVDGPTSPPSPSSTSAQAAGASLSERLLLEKLAIARQISSALQYMHERRLVYRDLKPPNVGLTADNQVRLFDFGFCRELPSWGGAEYMQVAEGEEDDDDALYYMSGKGSLMYLAPEVLYNGRYNRKADCYSFAMVLYELLTLNKPFHSVAGLEVFRELLCRHKARPPMEYSEIPDQLQDLLRHSWEDKVRERWTMRKINLRLQEISHELDPSFKPTSSLSSSGSQLATNQSSDSQHSSVFFDHAICGGGGLFLDLISGLADDVKSGYKILAGTTKQLEFQRDTTIPSATQQAHLSIVTTQPQQQQFTQCQDTPPTPERQLTGIHTATTEASSVFTADAHHSLTITPMTATEEPLEFTLEQAMSVPGWCASDIVPVEDIFSGEEEEEEKELKKEETKNFVPAIAYARSYSTHVDQDDDAFRDHAPLTPQREGSDFEGRCPPSPLERTTSAPPTSGRFLGDHEQQQQEQQGEQEGEARTTAAPLSPHYPPRRRQSWASNDKGGFYNLPPPVDDPESPHFPPRQRRQSTGGLLLSFDFPESHFLPTAVELRGSG